MATDSTDGKHRYSVSLVTQGAHRFYTLTVPSDILARTTFVSTRFEDPKEGFQRLLDKRRAQEIADYIDTGMGTIPNSIVLSAQKEAELRIIGRGKTIEFADTNKAFLVLDGQHRVYGFSLAKTSLRVPVVIYNNLSRKEESRLFIDINTKQRPVPNELLLDIKKLADYESETEHLLGALFDNFMDHAESPFLGLMSPSTRASGRLSRVTFNAGVRPVLGAFEEPSIEMVYPALNAYFSAFVSASDKHGSLADTLTNPIVFRATTSLFTDAAQRVQDRHGRLYTAEHFSEILRPMFRRLKTTVFANPGNSYRELYETMKQALRSSIQL